MIVQKIPFSFPGIAEDIVRYQELVASSLQSADVCFPSKVSILNLACGRADETAALIEAIRPAEISQYLAIDLIAESIAEAQARWAVEAPASLHFHAGDAARFSRLTDLPIPLDFPHFDLLAFRHQNYWHQPLIWESIISEAVAALKPSGYLIATSYFDLEHDLFLAALQTHPLELLLNHPHKASRLLSKKIGKSVDRHIAVFQKKPETSP